jgi:hypothetical protein
MENVKARRRRETLTVGIGQATERLHRVLGINVTHIANQGTAGWAGDGGEVHFLWQYTAQT